MAFRPGWVPWILITLVAVATAIAVEGRVRASGNDPSFNFDPYLHRPTGEMADPVNLIFRGGDLRSADEAMQRVMGWPHVHGGDMTFNDQQFTRATGVQLGLDLGGGSRWHMRIEAVENVDGQSYVLAGVHRDDTMPCGHVGLAFNEARNMVADSFSRVGYSASLVRLQNTLPGHQCDGRLTNGDGLAVMIDLGSHRLPVAAPLFPAGGFFAPLYLALR